jgi:hypothetical protein
LKDKSLNDDINEINNKFDYNYILKNKKGLINLKEYIVIIVDSQGMEILNLED